MPVSSTSDTITAHMVGCDGNHDPDSGVCGVPIARIAMQEPDSTIYIRAEQHVVDGAVRHLVAAGAELPGYDAVELTIDQARATGRALLAAAGLAEEARRATE